MRQFSSLAAALRFWWLVGVVFLLLCRWAVVVDCHESTSYPDNPDENSRDRHRRNERRHAASEAGESSSPPYWIGTGIYDITGPAAQINFMGYAKVGQTGAGIHQRLRARAFIVAQSSRVDGGDHDDGSKVTELKDENDEHITEEAFFVRSGSMVQRFLQWWGLFGSSNDKTTTNGPDLDPSRTVCFVSIDVGMGSDLLNQRVMERLEQAQREGQLNGQQQQLPLLCTLENLSISGTHTHSAPAGFLQYALFQMTSLGFSEESLGAYVSGVAQALQRAHDSLQPGSIDMAQGLLFDANINRSPSSYLLNPAAERDEYADHGDTDKTMLQLTFKQQDGDELGSSLPSTAVGVLNWFAVHGTSMNSSNLLISGDNKGYASYLMEKRYNGNMTLPGKGNFVAAFASTNLGDVSPNTAGPHCTDTGLPCDILTSSCSGSGGVGGQDDGGVVGGKGGGGAFCIASGPGKDMFESTEIIGRKQFDMAVRLKENNSANVALEGEVSFRHSFVDFSQLNVTLENGTVVQTCHAALGYSFAAGTTDGPGEFNFHQGTNTSNPFWNSVRSFLSKPSPEQVDCHAPKPILLNVGSISRPYRWEPLHLPISIFRIGQLYILNVPAEFTTMAGRRLRKTVKQVLVEEGGVEDPTITIAGLANSYSHYVTTFEEYSGQRYEAASTLYGPHTLSAYLQEFRRLTRDLINNQTSATRYAPADLTRWQLSLLPAVEFDTIGLGQRFGSVAVDARDQYTRGQTVAVSFRSANPRNSQRIEDTFLTVDWLDNYGQWQTVYVDGDWCTRYYWKGGLGYFGESFAEIHWTIPETTSQGLYRICHYGTQKTLLGDIENLIIRASGWLVTTFFGSPGLSTLLSTIDFSSRISTRMQRWLNTLGQFRFHDFHGCTKTFLVHNT